MQGFDPFGSLLGGVVAGVDKQTELAVQMAQDAFRQSQANFQQFDTNRKFEYGQEQDKAEQAYRQNALLQQGRIADQRYDMDKAELDARNKRDEENRLSREKLAKIKADASLLIAQNKTLSAEQRWALGKAIEYTDDSVTMEHLYNNLRSQMGSGQPPAQELPQAVPTDPAMPSPMMPQQPQGMDIMGMLTGQTPNAPQMPTGGTQNAPIAFGGNRGAQRDLMNARAQNLNQDTILDDKRFALELDKFSLTKQEKEEAIKQARLMNPLKRQETLQRIAESKSRVKYRFDQMQRLKANDAFTNSWRQAKTDAARKPEALKEWGMKERVQLETRKSKAQGEWRQNEKMLSDLKQQQNALLYGKTLEQLTPQERASYDSFQESIEETEAMKEASKADYYQYQQMAKEVGFFKADSPQGLAERGRANPRDLPVQPRNMGNNQAVLPKQQGSKTGVPTIVPPKGFKKPAPKANISNSLFEKYRAK